MAGIPVHPPPGSWRETAIAVTAASLLLWLMVQPAFQAYFFAEAFLYLGQYNAHAQDFWHAIVSPINGVFFRPVSIAASLPWYFVLPPDPWSYHLVNFAATVLVLLVLYRLLLRLVVSRPARLLALAFFTISKIHLTTIGYVNLLESPLTLLLLLLTLLFLLRYAATHRWRDYAAGLGCATLSLFVKDYGLVALVVATALMLLVNAPPSHWRTDGRYWLLRAAPFVPLALAYLTVRFAAVGSLPAGGASYALQFSLEAIARKTVVLLLTLPNVSPIDNGTTGAMGLGALIGPYLTVAARTVSVVDLLLAGAFLLLALATARLAHPRDWRWLFPLVWIAAYWGPTLLVRNVQIYYAYEALAGFAVLLGLCLDAPPRSPHQTRPAGLALPPGSSLASVLRRAWLVALVLIAANGLVSNYRSRYYWQQAAHAAQTVAQPLLHTYAGQPLDTLTFVTTAPAYWQFVLTADGKGPLLPVVLNRPTLQVHIAPPITTDLPTATTDNTHLILDLDRNLAPHTP